MKNDDFKKWLERIKFINEEYPFGELRILTNEDGNLHHDILPAYVSKTRVSWYRNGKLHGKDIDIYGSIAYYYDNVLVPSNYITDSANLTIKEVFNHSNAEVRYVGIKICGYDKIEKIAKFIDVDEDMKLFFVDKVFESPIAILKVINSTPEQDGSFKAYYLNVPPTMKTCKEAVAWTFYKDVGSYHPSVET
jgi:hypothetical protein